MNAIVQRIGRFGQDVGDALVGRRQRRSRFQRTEVSDRLDACVEVRRLGRTTCQHRLNGVDGVTFFLIPGAETAQHEFDNFVDDLGVGQLAAVQAHGLFGQGLQIQRQVFLNDNTQHAQRSTA
ncbi:hypothetical protein D3C78_1240050 [compost metagenome]